MQRTNSCPGQDMNPGLQLVAGVNFEWKRQVVKIVSGQTIFSFLHIEGIIMLASNKIHEVAGKKVA